MLECLEELFFLGDEELFLWKRFKCLMNGAKSFAMLGGSSDSPLETELASKEEGRDALALRACVLLRDPLTSRFSYSSISKVVSLSRMSARTRSLKPVLSLIINTM